jgi:serine acetyltransferase
MGRIVVGNDVHVGANTLVTVDVPDRAVVVGVPADIKSLRGSFDYLDYLGADVDEARERSLQLRYGIHGENG